MRNFDDLAQFRHMTDHQRQLVERHADVPDRFARSFWRRFSPLSREEVQADALIGMGLAACQWDGDDSAFPGFAFKPMWTYAWRDREWERRRMRSAVLVGDLSRVPKETRVEFDVWDHLPYFALAPRDRRIVSLLFLGYSRREIANAVGLSQPSISRLARRALGPACKQIFFQREK